MILPTTLVNGTAECGECAVPGRELIYWQNCKVIIDWLGRDVLPTLLIAIRPRHTKRFEKGVSGIVEGGEKRAGDPEEAPLPYE